MYFKIEDNKLSGNFTGLKDGTYEAKLIAKRRTNLQNRLYFGWYLPHIKDGLTELGAFITIEDLHDGLKEKILSIRKLNALTGTYKKYTRSTTELSKKEFTQYLKDVEYYILDTYEIVIPPHEDFNL